MPLTDAERARRYRERHPDRVREQRKLYEAKPDRQAYKKAWLDDNREHHRAYMRAYQKASPESYRQGSARRRARQRAGGRHTIQEWLDLLERYDGMCAYCGAEATEQEHVLPLSRGGTDNIGNILPSCVPCNRRKGNGRPEAWLRV